MEEDLFIGGYRLLIELGRGLATTVYKAWQENADRPVTLKVLTRPDAGALRRMEAEAKLTAQMADPNIRKIYEAGQTPDGQVFVALEFVDYSLREVLQQRQATHRPFSRDEIAGLLAPVALALDHLHQQGFVHLDVKPENILIFKNPERAILADLGIVQPRGTRTRAGTPLYASPEQAAGNRPVGPWSDVYSLGAVVYEMIAGRPPFQGIVDVALLRLHLDEQAPSLRRFRRDVSFDLDRTVLQALAKEPAQRYPTATAFVETLKRQPGRATEALLSTTMRIRSVPLALQRRRWMWLALLIAAVPILISLAAWWLSRSR